MSRDDHGVPNDWDSFWIQIKRLRTLVQATKSRTIRATQTTDFAKQTVQFYFRTLKPELVTQNIETSELDSLLRDLIKHSNARTKTSIYKGTLSGISKLKADLEIAREQKISDLALQINVTRSLANYEEKILATLNQLLPSSELSYKQVLLDLSDNTRVSYKGTAAELREILREVLDHLAPDAAVTKMPGFKLEPNRTGPTMVQKAKFILKSREIAENAKDAPLGTISLVEELTSKLVRDTYTRGSVSTHRSSPKTEINQLKMYVDTVLCELLEIHK